MYMHNTLCICIYIYIYIIYIHVHINIGGLGFTALISAYGIINFTLAGPPHHVSDCLRCFVAHNAVVCLPNQKEMQDAGVGGMEGMEEMEGMVQ